jgi:hypothetical protein
MKYNAILKKRIKKADRLYIVRERTCALTQMTARARKFTAHIFKRDFKMHAQKKRQLQKHQKISMNNCIFLLTKHKNINSNTIIEDHNARIDLGCTGDK